MDMPQKNTEDKWIETSRGVDSINFQRSAHITWVSVLMAMVVFVLAEKTYDILGKILTSGRWYLLLYVIASGLIVIQTWVQMTWLTLLSHSPIQASRSGITLLMGIAIYIICVSVESPAIWFLAAGFFGIISCLSLINGMRQRLITGQVARSLYKFVAVIGISVCITFLAAWHLTIKPSALTAWFWGVIAIILMTNFLWLQSRNMKEERSDLDIPA